MIAGAALALALVLALLAFILAALWSLRGAVAALHREVAQLQRGAVSTDDLRATVTAAVVDATAPEAAVNSAAVSRVPVPLRRGPVIKAMALGSGTAHVARRLRGGGNGVANGHGRNGH